MIILALSLGGLTGIAQQPRQSTELSGKHATASAAEAARNDSPAPPSNAIVEMTPKQMEAAGIQVRPCTRQLFSDPIEVTGKVTVNEDRLAHIYPMVSGLAEKLSVQLGARVQADQLLATIHSPEIARVKLDLYSARLELKLAQTRLDLFSEVASNTEKLLARLRSGAEITDLEEEFKGSHMGAYRARLLSTYAQYLKSEADFQRLQAISGTGAVAQKTILSAETSRNAALAVFQSTLEEVTHELRTTRLELTQQVQQAESKIAVGETNLRVLGVREQEIGNIDPASQGQAISDYPVRAPFAGAVVSKDVVLGERVTPDKLLFSLADLSEVWITADIFESQLPLLHDLAGETISVRSPAWPDREFPATIFYTGDLIDEATRTLGMRASAANPEELLKPGMFVTVFLPDKDAKPSLVVPLESVQQHENHSFVFVQLAPGRYARRDVRVAGKNRSVAAITEGLREGELVVTQGSFVLKSLMLSSLLEEE